MSHLCTVARNEQITFFTRADLVVCPGWQLCKTKVSCRIISLVVAVVYTVRKSLPLFFLISLGTRVPVIALSGALRHQTSLSKRNSSIDVSTVQNELDVNQGGQDAKLAERISCQKKSAAITSDWLCYMLTFPSK